MEINVIATTILVSQSGIYDCKRLECNGVKCTVTNVIGARNYVNVSVHNAMQKAWGGMGKDFPTIEEALKAYKNPKIKAMIAYQVTEAN